MTTLEDLGESAAIDKFQSMLSSRPDVVVGPGDDCAVVRCSTDNTIDLLLTSDPVIEGIHFEAGTAPHLIGRKAMGRALSDIAAMGGTPTWALVNLSSPGSIKFEVTEQIVKGAEELASEHGLAIVGGDLAEGPVLQLNVFAMGSLQRDSAILRSGAQPGHSIFVTGTLGGSRLGKHLDFSPRVNEGTFLREHGISSMIDLSDGLGSDLWHICEASDVGARLIQSALPLSDELKKMAEINGLDPYILALSGGEDYRLLITVPKENSDRFQKMIEESDSCPIFCVGEITGDNGIGIILPNGMKDRLDVTGFDHFIPSHFFLKK